MRYKMGLSVGAVMPRHGGSWKLPESVAYGDGVGVSTEAARDDSNAIGHLSSGE